MKRYLRKTYDLQLARTHLITRTFVTSCRCSQQQPAEHDPDHASGIQDGPPITRIFAPEPSRRTDGLGFNRQKPKQVIPRSDGSQQNYRRSTSTTQQPSQPKPPQPSDVSVFIDNEPHKFSAVLLRDLCECPSCVDSSTKQKLFSTADIPSGIRARAVAQTSGGTSILWDQDVPGYDRGHTTELSSEVLRNLAHTGFVAIPYSPGQQVLWDAETVNQVTDIDYEAYMQDDMVLYKALHLLHTHGLLFVSNVPESERSVSTIGERIGPIKNTFYGYTWDVRSVPEAKNVAYTSQDLGFHMDLLYMHQPPHLQLLHCIRSSARGGASLFADSYRAAQELFQQNLEAFYVLSRLQAVFHYNHPTSHLYRQQRPVFEMKHLTNGGANFTSVKKLAEAWESNQSYKISRPPGSGPLNIVNYINNVSWSPPFQGPFSLSVPPREDGPSKHPPLHWLNKNASDWNAAAREYSALIHRPEGIHERMMRPGECVIFDNRRVLHARRAFEVGDAGTERWLRGAYLDKDPYVSKLQVLQKRFEDVVDAAAVPEMSKGGDDEYFEAASSS